MKINMQKWSDDIIAGKEVKNLPILYFPVLKNIGMSVIDSISEPDNIAEVMKEVIDEYPDTIAAITGMDLTVDTEAFGGVVNYSEKQAPNIKIHPAKTPADIMALKVPDIHSGRVDIFNEAVTRASGLIQDRPVMGGMLGPFSLAADIIEVTDAMMMTIKDRETLKVLLDKTTEWLIKRAQGYKNAGANGVLIAEPTAGLLKPSVLDELSSQYIKKIVDAVQDDYFFVILHDCGRVTKSVESMYNTGCKGHSYGNGVDMKDILPQIPADILVLGNLDPSEVFFMGTPDEVGEKTRMLLEEMKDYPHFVLSSGCDLAPAVSNENIEAYFEACRRFNEEQKQDTKI